MNISNQDTFSINWDWAKSIGKDAYLEHFEANGFELKHLIDMWDKRFPPVAETKAAIPVTPTIHQNDIDEE